MDDGDGAGGDEIPDLPDDRVASIPFYTVCKSWEKCASVVMNSRQKLQYVLPKVLLELGRKGQGMYPYFRLLMPEIDGERNNYGAKERKLADWYREAAGIPPNHPEAVWLLNYSNQNLMLPGDKYRGAISGNFTTVLRAVLRGRQNKGNQWTLKDVNDALDSLYKANKREEKVAVLRHVFDHCNAEEQMWFARVVLKDLKIGLSYERILRHVRAKELYDSTTSLRSVSNDPRVTNPTRWAEERRGMLKPMTGFVPMLCQRMRYVAGESVMGEVDFFVEPKLDGERVLLHKKGHNLKMLSRKDKQGSQSTAFASYVPSLQSWILKAVRATDVILDCEIVGWDDSREEMVPFGHGRTIGREVVEAVAAGTTSTRWMCLHVFDVLYLRGCKPAPDVDGELTERPLSERKEILQKLIVVQPRRVEIVQYDRCVLSDVKLRREYVIDKLSQAVDNKFEGIVLKSCASKYSVGTRSQAWIKVKPDYLDPTGGVNDMDVLVVGAFFGSRHGVSQGTVPVRILSKVGTGYDKLELERVQAYMRDGWRKCRSKRDLPGYFQGWKPNKADDMPDVVADRPENSIVVQLHCAELATVVAFAADVGPRFPRIEAFRWDKPWRDALTHVQLREMYDNWTKQVASNLRGRDLVDGRKQRKKRKKKQAGLLAERKALAVLPSFELTDTSAVKPGEAGKALAGISFVVSRAARAPSLGLNSRQDIEKLIKSLDGKITANRVQATRFVVTSRPADFDGNKPGTVDLKVLEPQVANIVRARDQLREEGPGLYRVDVVTPELIAACRDEGRLVALRPEYVVSASKSTLKEFADKFDEFRLAYFELASPEQYRAAVVAWRRCRSEQRPGTDQEGHQQLDAAAYRSLMDDEDTAFMLKRSRLHQFAGMVAYVDRYAEVRVNGLATGGAGGLSKDDGAGECRALVDNDRLFFASREFALRCGESATSIHPQVRVIIVDHADRSRFSALSRAIQQIKDGGAEPPIVVEAGWVDYCCERDCANDTEVSRKYAVELDGLALE